MSLFGSLGGLISNAINNNPGGLSGLMQQAFSEVGGLDGVVAKLNEAGLGAQVNSWLGRGENQPISADDIRSVLGNEQLSQVAAKLGIPMDQVANILSEHLPTAVDHASPNGTIETTGA